MTLVLILGLIAVVVAASFAVLRMVSKFIPDSHSFWHEFKSDSAERNAFSNSQHADSSNLAWPRL